MPKTYVLDTNVLLHDPQAIHKFDEHDLAIPIYVIEEIDTFKKDLSELGRNARAIARTLDDLREQSHSSLQHGVTLPSGGTLRVIVPPDRDQVSPKGSSGMDLAILKTAMSLDEENEDDPVILVTMDTNLRIRADASGLRAENYEGGRVVIDQLYSGVVRIGTSKENVDLLARRETIDLDSLELEEGQELFPNACVVLCDRMHERHTALGRVDSRKGELVPLIVGREGAWGVRPRNMEQYFALDMLLNPDVHLVTLVGKAGTGKTLLAIAAGLRAVMDEGVCSRLLVSRPIFPMGRDVGFLPGTIEEKLNPWMQPIFDNLEYIFSHGRKRMADVREYSELVTSGVIEVEPLTYIRGRSLPNQFLIVDEAQNLTPHEVKTVITRCGAETKIVLTGDPHQIDNPYVDAASNGLTTVAQRFRTERISGHITLTKGERSELAERATQLL